MTTTISDGSDTYTVTQVDGYTATRTGRNVLHPIIGSNAYAVSLRRSTLRSGTMRCLFTDVDIAEQVMNMLANGLELTLYSTDRVNISMSFVLAGEVNLELDDVTRNLWWVEFDWQETD